MKLFFYELRKTYLRNYMFVLWIALSVLDVLKIGLDYRQGSIDQLILENSVNQAAFEQLYAITKGSISNEKKQFLNSEEQRLGDIYQRRLSYDNPNEVTYSGNLYEDYYLLEVYIAKQFHYIDEYEAYSNTITELALENVLYYQTRNNSLKAAENSYIAEQYSHRSISQFYRTDAIDSYLNFSFSTVLILFLCFLGVAPIFLAEQECGMDMILSTSKHGGTKSTFIKLLAAICYSFVLVIWFCALDWISYQIFRPFEGLDNPIWAIQSFQESFLNCSIENFILHEISLKLLAISVIALLLAILSLLFRKILHTALAFLLILGGCYATSSWVFSPAIWKQLLALCNPIKLLTNISLYQKFYIIEWGNHFTLASTLCILTNVILGIFLILLIFLVIRRRKK